MKKLVFLKLGGSLITEKNIPHTANHEAIHFLANEIRSVLQANTNLSMVLGHGSGSFGHVPAKKYHTRDGVRTPVQWLGFTQVWLEANALNRIVIDAFVNSGLPVISLPPSASLFSSKGKVQEWNTHPIKKALEHNLLPVIFGDVIFDYHLGGTIFSTEQLFSQLARELHPDQILITGSEAGVWQDFPTCSKVLGEITPAEYPELSKSIFPSNAVDVTGGMASKVAGMVDLVRKQTNLQVTIFNPLQPGSLAKALSGESIGTLIHN